MDPQDDDAAAEARPPLLSDLVAGCRDLNAAGNLTLIGSVANIIVAEKGRCVGGIGFWEYLRVGLPLALLTTAFGPAWVVALC